VFEWLSNHWREPRNKRSAHVHILAALREIGILLVALSPLESIIRENEKKGLQWGALIGFILVGLFVFALGTIGEWRFPDDS
jgi:hypothetical protein